MNTSEKTIALYNADDCFSTRSLRDWLERERQALEQAGHRISRPTMSDGAPPESIGERQRQTAALAEALKRGVSSDPAQRNEEDAARWLLANLLDWHRRESKADWWEYFRLKDMTDEDLLDERCALSGLRFVERLGVQRKIPTDRYSFEKQETDIRAGDTVCERGENVGEVVEININARTIDIKKTRKTADTHPKSVFVDAKTVNRRCPGGCPVPSREPGSIAMASMPRDPTGRRETSCYAAARVWRVGLTRSSSLMNPPWTPRSASGHCLIVLFSRFRGLRDPARHSPAHA